MVDLKSISEQCNNFGIDMLELNLIFYYFNLTLKLATSLKSMFKNWGILIEMFKFLCCIMK